MYTYSESMFLCIFAKVYVCALYFLYLQSMGYIGSCIYPGKTGTKVNNATKDVDFKTRRESDDALAIKEFRRRIKKGFFLPLNIKYSGSENYYVEAAEDFKMGEIVAEYVGVVFKVKIGFCL